MSYEKNSLSNYIQYGMPQIRNYIQITLVHINFEMQQIQYVENSHSEVPKSLVQSLPVKEEEKLHINLVSKQNTCAMDMIGLSWIFEDEL